MTEIQIVGERRMLKVRAVVRGEFAIHQELNYVEVTTGKPLYAITHVPSGLRLFGYYRLARCLRAALRYLADKHWPDDPDTVQNTTACKLDAVSAMEQAESGFNWWDRHNYDRLREYINAQS